MTRIWVTNWLLRSIINLWCKHKFINVVLSLFWQMSELPVWHFWSANFDQLLQLQSSIEKWRKQSCIYIIFDLSNRWLTVTNNFSESCYEFSGRCYDFSDRSLLFFSQLLQVFYIYLKCATFIPRNGLEILRFHWRFCKNYFIIIFWINVIIFKLRFSESSQFWWYSW